MERWRWAKVALAGLLVSACSGGGEPECQPGETACDATARFLTTCEDGQERVIDCLATMGGLCEGGVCVDPWRYGSPGWDGCAAEPLATPESLAEKAEFFEAIARRLHISLQLRWIAGVTLPCDGADCSRPGVDPETATTDDVESWLTGENDGLWSALYLAAEAFRYGATRDPEALEVIRELLEGERWRMEITGVPGVFTRQYIPPDVPGIGCPTDLAEYVPDEDKNDNQWVRVGQTGCIEVADAAGQAWVTTTRCGLDDYPGFCWLDNVSRDEYAGHMFALGALAKLVDDPGIQETVKDLLLQIGTHLVTNKLTTIDWDGRPTEHGRYYAMSLDEFPGFNAAMILGFMKMAVAATGDATLLDFYDNCLLQKGGEIDCLGYPSESPRPYTEYLANAGMYVGEGNCLSNWNNISMHFASLHNMIWFERDPAVRGPAQQSLAEIFDPPAGTARPVSEQNNTWFDFIFAAHKPLGPGSDGPALSAVRNGICMLRQFPARKDLRAIECPADKCRTVCQDRKGDDLGAYPRPIAERCVRQFVWWGNPYDPDGCAADPRRIEPPNDYLLAYWMGRYYGFIDESW